MLKYRMDRKAILDLLALVQADSISLAAQARNSSQSGYSRRLQALEHQLGVPLVDRTKRPSGATLTLKSLALELDTALVALNRLNDAFSIEPSHPLRIAAVHSISASILPQVFAALDDVVATHDIRLRSANVDVCFQMLMTEDVVASLVYESDAIRIQTPHDLVQRTSVGYDQFVPVCSHHYYDTLVEKLKADDPISIIVYPSEFFLGELTRSSLLPRIECKVSLKLISGLTQAVKSSIVCGLGIGWLPLTAMRDELNSGKLIKIPHLGFPESPLELTVMRLRTKALEGFQPTLDAICTEISKLLATH